PPSTVYCLHAIFLFTLWNLHMGFLAYPVNTLAHSYPSSLFQQSCVNFVSELLQKKLLPMLYALNQILGLLLYLVTIAVLKILSIFLLRILYLQTFVRLEKYRC